MRYEGFAATVFHLLAQRCPSFPKFSACTVGGLDAHIFFPRTVMVVAIDSPHYVAHKGTRTLCPRLPGKRTHANRTTLQTLYVNLFLVLVCPYIHCSAVILKVVYIGNSHSGMGFTPCTTASVLGCQLIMAGKHRSSTPTQVLLCIFG